MLDRPVSPLGVVAPPPIHIASPKFEGSLATLFTCVRDHKVDLRDVPLAPICEAYLAYMLADSAPNLDEAAAALAALAYLLERKAWSLLPIPESEPEEEELSELPECSTFEYKLVIEALRSYHEEREGLFFRTPGLGPNPYELPYELEDIQTSALADALQRVLERARPVQHVSVARSGRSLTDEMGKVLVAISRRWQSLEDLIPLEATREDVVYWFLSILELMRLGQVRARIADSDVEFSRA
ncbi:MAG TPA: segregation/condensation protein A [Fimbriimonas sp.]|nr:segregation/condensation protein A [Fimbriimonas sp.]